MKKTVSMMLAILVAAITVCTFATSAFANPEITVPSDDRFNPVTTTKATTTASPTTAATTTAAPTTAATTTAAPTTAATTTAAPTTEDEVVTRDPNYTVIDEGTTKAPTTAKPATTKPAPNVSDFPDTGSGSVTPIIALLALAAGAVAVVKTKKDN